MDEVSTKDVLKVMWKEFRIALIVGTTLAIANGLRVFIQYHDFKIAIVVALTLIFTVIIAKLLGCTMPMIAKKLKLDPAIMASPLITTMVDACSVFIFFNIATIILHLN